MVQAKLQVDLESLTAGIYSPTIAWNTKKRHIVDQMTESECITIARRTTSNLRGRSPDIRRYIDNAASVRRKYAKLLFTQELVKSDLLSEAELTMHGRMARLAKAQLNHQEEIVEFFRNESGYRICCLTALAGEMFIEQSTELLHDMDVLSTQQNSLGQALLLDDLLSILVKQATKYPEFNSTGQRKKYEIVLVDLTTRIRKALENCKRPNSDESVAKYLNTLHAEQPTLNDSTHAAMLSFSLTKKCFETLNLELLNQFAEVTKACLYERPEFMLQSKS